VSQVAQADPVPRIVPILGILDRIGYRLFSLDSV